MHDALKLERPLTQWHTSGMDELESYGASRLQLLESFDWIFSDANFYSASFTTGHDEIDKHARLQDQSGYDPIVKPNAGWGVEHGKNAM